MVEYTNYKEITLILTEQNIVLHNTVVWCRQQTKNGLVNDLMVAAGDCGVHTLLSFNKPPQCATEYHYQQLQPYSIHLKYYYS